jgi:hypothetical protein
MIWPNGYYSRVQRGNILAAGHHSDVSGCKMVDKVSAGQDLEEMCRFL